VEFFVYLIAFGGNTGDRVQNARGSLSQLEKFGRIGRQSRWSLTEPLRSDEHDTSDHDVYLNFIFEFETQLEPDALYAEICRIEDTFGHDRVQRWRPRAVDFDLLFFCRITQVGQSFEPSLALQHGTHSSGLRIPHPQVWERNFLLEMIESDLKIPLFLLKRL
jgi:2-amino-4-hydroxy-6-hydroxymethyldihydropteridine diphosphokinase